MKLFENAKKYYAEARDILAKLADSVPEGKTEGTRDAHRRSTLRQYNVIMQTVMLACAVADGKIIGLDKRYALEQVKAGEVLVEYDKLIDQQLERAAITSIAGFAKICDGAAAVLNV